MTKHPDETMPALKPTDTQRFHSPLESKDDPNKTHPNIVVREFPKGSPHAPEVPPSREGAARPQVGETRVNQDSLKVVVTKVHDDGGFDGIDGNGITFYVPKDTAQEFKPVEADSDFST